MKQKLFFLIVVSVLATIPALAHGVPVGDVSDFGTFTGDTLTTTANGFGFELSITVKVYSMDAGGGATKYTYVYDVAHDSANPLILTTIFDMDFDPTLDTGYVGADDPFIADTDFTDGKLRFHFNAPATLDANGNPTGNPPILAYAQSYLGPVTGIYYMGLDGGFDQTGFAATLGPGDPGGGSGLDPVPEPGSLILLTSGLLSGGYLKFKRRNKN